MTGAPGAAGAPPPVVTAALAALWRLRPPGPGNLFQAPEFERLRDACRSSYDNAGGAMALTFALGTALSALGAPFGLAGGNAALALPAEEAARRLHEGFVRRSVGRRHLCPLDLADRLPDLLFGPCEVRRFSAAELAAAADAPRLRRVHPGAAAPDWARLAEFDWLVVEEEAVVPAEPGARATPGLYADLGEDLGRVHPHAGRFPVAVEDGLFFLLLAPWETWVRYPEIDWRAFRIPWVHTADDDLFVRSPQPPSPETLSWEPDVYTDPFGDPVEVERPTRLPLTDKAEAAATLLDAAAWSEVTEARRSCLFETPVAHFMVRAFLSEGVDELLAHMTAIEAALGLRSDFGGQAPRRAGKRQGGAKDRVATRIGALLGDEAAARRYGALYEVRSAFLHGRPMTAISTAERVGARALARRVVSALVASAVASPGLADRETFLSALLDGGGTP